jgi:Protein of unknown function (DUF642)
MMRLALNKIHLLVLVGFSIFANGGASANLITNGDFENSVPSTGWQSSATTGFQNINTYRACCAPTGTYASGPNVAFFGWDNLAGGSIWQDVNTTIGQIYTVSFDYGAIARARLQTLNASARDGTGFTNVVASAALSAVGSANLSNITSSYSYAFVANSASTRIMFTDTSLITNSVDGVLDNVSVTAAIPLPYTFGLVIAGALGLLVAHRRWLVAGSR